MPCHLGDTVMVKDAMKKSPGVPEIYHTKQSRVTSQASTQFSQNLEILRELGESISRVLDSQTVTYTNEMRRALCNKLLVQLPTRELRDIIYEDIVPAKTVIVVAGDEDTSGSAGQTETCCPTSAPSTPCNLVWNADTKHLWKREKVGNALLAEMIQTWYRKQTFVITEFEPPTSFSQIVGDSGWYLASISPTSKFPSNKAIRSKMFGRLRPRMFGSFEQISEDLPTFVQALASPFVSKARPADVTKASTALFLVQKTITAPFGRETTAKYWKLWRALR
ncbi:hypothetical protein BKA66DRAFT_566356 [Pyrenochaeta sp. MPI-SDFR-AT-0127]|nr:hypothetical protein BKA66DRAFT_566356 [Pyrenochaeta sp. MPI-SDFR-AT-0127]